MLGSSGISKDGGLEGLEPISPEPPLGQGEKSTQNKAGAQPGKTMESLKRYFISELGEEEGMKMYNSFVSSSIVMPMIQQMQKDEAKMKEAEKGMMGG